MRHSAAPDGYQDYADQNQAEGQAEPQAARSHAFVKTEPHAYRQTDNPVAGEMAEHGSAGVAGAAEGSGGDYLQSVEKLKERRDA